jgi:3-oxoacyl-[acyl-carrier-protein] synthase-1/3-oxoacyl-[acyl-carrier-protein] synthase II
MQCRKLQASKDRIAITGFGCSCGAGQDSTSVWHSIRQGVVNCRAGSGHLFPANHNAPVFSVESDGLSEAIHLFFLKDSWHHGWLKNLNRTLILTLTVIAEALAVAGLDLESLQEQRVGIALGTTIGCSFNNETYYIDWKKGKNPDRKPVFHYLSANLAERVQDILGVRGPRAVVTNACASGTNAIGLAKMWLEHDLCDIAIAGGADELSRIACHGFAGLMLISSNPCRPFDAKRDGLNLGEGAGIFVMEKEKRVLARNGNLAGWVKGYGAASDAYHPTAPHPEGRGLQQAVRNAMANAGVAISDVAIINAHGTGTQANDSAETSGLQALGFGKTVCPIVSTKGATGHTLGAAGGIAAVLTLLALNNGETFGTIGCRTPDSNLGVAVLAENEQTALIGRTGMSQSLAFGGGNAALILEGSGL